MIFPQILGMILPFSEVYRTLPAAGWLSEPEARLLWETGQRATGAIVEVGCYYGRSTVLLAALGRPVYSTDPFANFDTSDPSGETIRRGFFRNLEERGIINVTLFPYAIERLPDSMRAKLRSSFPGLIYLDGDHGYRGTQSQVEFALDLKPQLIAVHDIAESGGGVEVQRAAVELLGPWQERVERLAVWERRK